MKRTIKLLVFISILAGLTSCSNDIIESTDPVVPEGYIRATLDLQVEKPDSVQTRATDAEEIDYDKSNIWVLMFNATSTSDATPTTLVQAPVRAIESGTQLFVLLRATTQPVTVYVVTGLSAALNTEMAMPANFTEGVTDLDDVKDLLQTASIDATGVPIGSGSYFHMVSEPGFYSTGTIPLTTITHQLIRNVAKINVDASALSTSVFELEGVTLVNGAQKGYVFPQTTVTPNHGGTMQYNEVTTVSNNKIVSQIYLYENTGFLSNGTTQNPTKLVIKGKYNGVSGYYRMDILKDKENDTYTPYDIKRNCCYTLVIKKIENGGYLTLGEAIDSEPSNTWYNVDVNDPNAFDVVSNGHYYLGVSNSEFIVYGNTGQIENLHVATVTTDAPAGTQDFITPSAGISAVTSSLTAPNGMVTTTNISATFSATTNGYIDIRVGNLTKRITVRREAAVNANEIGEKTDFTDTNYYKGEVVSGKDWVRLAATTNADFSLSPTVLTKPNGGIYVRYNSTLNTNPSSPAEVYVIKTNNQGRAKMLLFTP